MNNRLQYPLQLLLLLILACLLVPLAPRMPEQGLDPSWMYAMNQAVADHLVFGRDLIFTFGPFAGLYTRTYHPATDGLLLGGGLFLAVSLWLVLLPLLRQRLLVSLLLCFLLVLNLGTSDNLLLLAPLLCILHCAILLRRQPASALQLFALFGPFGLLVLIKGTALIICSLLTLLSLLLLLYYRQWRNALLAVASPLLVCIAGWLLAGQPLDALADYFRHMLPIIAGYTDAMSVEGVESEPISYLLAATAILLASLCSRTLRWPNRLYLFAALGLLLLVAGKAGLVRHDDTHATISANMVMLCALLLAVLLPSRATLLTILLTLPSWMFMETYYFDAPFTHLIADAQHDGRAALHGLQMRLQQPEQLPQAFAAARQQIAAHTPLPVLPGTTDVYPFDQSALLASDNRWNTRPILQSYSAYTRQLAELNRDHLQGSQAPDNLLVRIEPIDGRLASMDDGLSWPQMLARYQLVNQYDKYLHLQRRPVPLPQQERLLQGTQPQRLGEWITLPPGTQPLYARLQFATTLPGSLFSLLYKPQPLLIEFRFATPLPEQQGKQQPLELRLVPGVTSSGFMIAPLIRKTADFASLFAPCQQQCPPRPTAFRIRAASADWQWQPDFTLEFLDYQPAGPSAP